MKRLILSVILCFSFLSLHAELRHNAAWVTLLTNIDWPSVSSKKIKDDKQRADLQKKEFIKIADSLKASGIDTIVLQVRPCADRMWESELNLEPWSRYFTGTQGKHPGFDPLAFVIEEAHKRGMELHASFNPFRISTNKKEPLAQSHPAVKNPNWAVTYGEQIFYDPALWQVRQHSAKVIEEVMLNYNIDAVHLDDYFYPYPVAGEDKGTLPFMDMYEGKTDQKTNDLRRRNINWFMQLLRDNVDAVNAKQTPGKPKIKLGVSPFAIWKNDSTHPTGKKTFSSYEGMYADTKLWIEKGLLDYITPQIYWHHAHKAAAFLPVLKWWETTVSEYNKTAKTRKTDLYIGLAAFRHGQEIWGPEQESKAEINKQMERCKNSPNVDGCMIYSAKFFENAEIKTTVTNQIKSFKNK